MLIQLGKACRLDQIIVIAHDRLHVVGDVGIARIDHEVVGIDGLITVLLVVIGHCVEPLHLVQMRHKAVRRRNGRVGGHALDQLVHLLTGSGRILEIAGHGSDLGHDQRRRHHCAQAQRGEHNDALCLAFELGDDKDRADQDQRRHAVGVLEIHIVLVLPALHEVDRDDREQQDQGADLLGRKRRERHGREHPEDERQLFGGEHLLDQEAHIEEHGLEHGEEALLAVDEIIAQSADHDALAADRRDDLLRNQEVDDRHAQHDTAAQKLPAVDHPKERDRDQVDRRVLLDHQQHKRKDELPYRVFAQDEVEQEQDDGGQKFIFMEIIEGAVDQAGVEGVHQLEREGQLARKAQLAADQIHGEHTCRHRGALHIEQVQRTAENVIARQEEVEDRREMHAEMRHHMRALHRCTRREAHRHALIHLSEDAEVEREVGVGAVFDRRQIAEHDGGQHEQHRRNDQRDLAADGNARNTELIAAHLPQHDDQIHHADADAEQRAAVLVVRREQHRYRDRREHQRPRDDITVL